MEMVGGITKEQFMKLAEEPQPDAMPIIAQAVITAFERNDLPIPDYISFLMAQHILQSSRESLKENSRSK